jgi:kynurenine formamidase
VKITDLTHCICPDMPVFPGTEPPVFEQANTLEENGFIEARITMYSHTGTHIDAPAHMFKDGRTLDEFPIEHFVGNAAVLDFSSREIKQIEVGDLQPFEPVLADNVEFVILKTGWSKYWGTPQYFEGFSYLTDEAATWLTQFHLKGIGIDAISIDAMDSIKFSVHKIFMQRNILIVENLTNLSSLDSKPFLFSVMPLKTKCADGSPARAVAMNCVLAKKPPGEL